MAIPEFDPKELTIEGRVPSIKEGPGIPVYKFPVSGKEGILSVYRKEPIWQVMLGFGAESINFVPAINPDNIARAFTFDKNSDPTNCVKGGKDIFGIEWEYVESAGGSMVRPGKPFIEDANEIAEKVRWPDIDSWDWEGYQKSNEGFLSDKKLNYCTFMNGWYERLISFMDFEGAVVAMIDEDQQDAVKAFFDQLSDLYITILDKYLTYFPEIDLICMHDDWGSQKDTFFSPATAEEMIVPYMKRCTDFIHSKGRFCDLHSCGQNMKQLSNIIKAGWDSWNPQAMNDTHKMYEDYGDQIILGVMPEVFDPQNTSEEEQRALAKAYAQKFCNPDKPSLLNQNALFASDILTDVYREELYKQSRINYQKK
ncbi:MAG: uroporphyrinogen decarboxylase family protein [Desulfobacteraceae bacterium]|jgi:hypothetical protein